MEDQAFYFLRSRTTTSQVTFEQIQKGHEETAIQILVSSKENCHDPEVRAGMSQEKNNKAQIYRRSRKRLVVLETR